MMMVSKRMLLGGMFTLILAIAACAAVESRPQFDKESARPGGVVNRGDKRFSLLGTPIAVGKPLPSVSLVDAETLTEVDLSQQKGQVLFLSIVPSIDTRVCEVQTHYLGEEGDRLSNQIQRVTISRDTPFAQRRFAEEAKLTDIRYLSDYKRGDFGRATGLLMEGYEVLARSVILTDKNGLVRYIQVVPEMTHMPDMERAFQEAGRLSKED